MLLQVCDIISVPPLPSAIPFPLMFLSSHILTCYVTGRRGKIMNLRSVQGGGKEERFLFSTPGCSCSAWLAVSIGAHMISPD